MANRVTLFALAVVAALGGLLWWAWESMQTHRPVVLQVPVATRPVAQSLAAVRVLLTSTPVNTVELRVDGPFRVQPVGNTQLLGQVAKLGSTHVKVVSAGFQIAGRKYPVSRLEIIPEKSLGIWIAGHQYRGSVRFYRHPGGKLTAVNVLPLEEYLASVVDSEMPAAFPVEARKAQAIVARTYALYQLNQANRASRFDLYADTRSQKYLGYQYRDSTGRLLAGESAASRRIIEETRGMVCTFRGKIFCTYYSAVCGGRTLQGQELFSDAVPAVTSVPCDWCREAKYYRWTATLKRRDVQAALRREKPGFGTLKDLRPAGATQPGKLGEFEARDERSGYRIRATRLRSMFTGSGIRSPHFQIQQQGDGFLIQGRGHGHGVGLCQWGARGQALAGRSAVEIVRHYYPGAEVVVAVAGR